MVCNVFTVIYFVEVSGKPGLPFNNQALGVTGSNISCP